MTKLVLISAVAENGLIGRANDLPWKIPADLKFFKQTTLDHVMLMGSKTWRSFGSRCLPRRHHVIVTKSPGTVFIPPSDYENVTIAEGLELAITSAKLHAEKRGQDKVFVIGGGEVYRQTIDRADQLVITRVWGDWPTQEGDIFFPEIDGARWKLVNDPYPVTDGDISYSIGRVYEKR